MPFYEHVFLARQDLSTAQVDQLAADFIGIIEANGGKVTKTEYWGVKSLSYRIKKNRKAHYVLLNIDAPPAAVAEMERNSGLSEDVIRSMTVRMEALEEGPSAMMRAKERSDRGDRAERGDRPERGERPERGDRPERGERFERRERADRPERAPRY
jgi:small subunit ribosomal protein S6